MSGSAHSRNVVGPLTVSVLVLCALGTVALTGSHKYSPAFAAVFAVAAALRLGAGRRGRALLPRRLLVPVGYTVLAVALGYLFHQLGRQKDGEADALWTLMCITSLFQALVLLWRQTTFSSFLLILFTSVHGAGIAFAFRDTRGLIWTAAYVALLVWTLVLFERRAALEREEEASGDATHLRADGVRALPWWAAMRTAAVLVLIGLPLGAGIYLATPRFRLGDPMRPQSTDDTGEGIAAAAGIEPERPTEARTEFAFAGPGGEGAPLGSVAEIKRNFEPWFEVGLADGSAMPPTVILRDNARDFYDPRGIWRDTLSEEGRDRVHRDIDDGRRDGRIPLEHAARRGGPTLRIELLRGGQTRLYLQPDEASLELRREGKALTRVTVRERVGKMFDASRPLKAGDVILQRYVPPRSQDVELVGRRSDSSVAPMVSYLQVPASCRGPLRARALQVVGGETDPWRRARLLEAWLKSEAFTYSLKIPPLDKRNPLVDFVERTRSANCEAFAYALTIMLRTLGHPARYVRGFWGGDRQEQRRTVILRGLHYHAWTEMFLEGAGWIALNPTPPDRRAVDADTLTAAQQAWEERQSQPEPAWNFLGYDEAAWRAFWRNAARGAEAWVIEPVGTLFQSRGGYSGIPLLLLVVLLVRRGRERARLREMVVPPGRTLPAGPYGAALLLLARKGVRRRPSHTARELLRHAAARFPDAADPLRRLTVLHEDGRYGGRARAELRGEATRELERLRQALKPRKAK